MDAQDRAIGSAPADFSELANFLVDPSAAALLPLDYCIEHQVVVLGRPADSVLVTLGMLSPRDKNLVDEIAGKLHRPVSPVQLNAFEIHVALSRIFGIAIDADQGDVITLDAPRTIDFTPGRPATDLLNDLLAEAIRRRATDLHIECYHHDVDLRFRIDGVLHQVTTPLSPDNITRVISRLKVLCDLDLAERRRAQDGRFSALYRENGTPRRIDLRVTILPGPYGQDAAIRVLDPARFITDLDALDMPPSLCSRWRRLIRAPHGLLLTTGPTSSGKTTTLYASVRELSSSNLKIVSVEDPIEYEFPKVNQKHATPQMGFADHLRSFLRANPDIILVGEIRDAETAEIAVRAGTTGHLILSTLHTGDAIAAIGRLRALGIPDDYLSDVLIGILGQRLVRRLCSECREECAPDPELVTRYFAAPPVGPFWRGRGCERCAGSGYFGLVGVYELLEPNLEIDEAIGRGMPVEHLRRIAPSHGWAPLVEDAIQKAQAGLTTLEEIARRIGA